MDTKFSSVAKGNILEDKFYAYLENELSNDRSILGNYNAKHCRLYKKNNIKTKQGRIR